MIVNPYLHFDADRIYNPLLDRAVTSGERDFSLLRDLQSSPETISRLGAADLEKLRGEGWLVDPDEDLSHRFLLKYVSIETHTVCNQGCYFCPVSFARREKYFMPDELYEKIVAQLAAYRESIEGVSTIQYNEPTVDRRFVEQVRHIKDAGLPPAVLSNGSNLVPETVDALVAMGGIH